MDPCAKGEESTLCTFFRSGHCPLGNPSAHIQWLRMNTIYQELYICTSFADCRQHRQFGFVNFIRCHNQGNLPLSHVTASQELVAQHEVSIVHTIPGPLSISGCSYLSVTRKMFQCWLSRKQSTSTRPQVGMPQIPKTTVVLHQPCMPGIYRTSVASKPCALWHLAGSCRALNLTQLPSALAKIPTAPMLWGCHKKQR